MANPVNNGGISAKISVGKLLDVDVKIGGTAKVSEDQGRGIFQNVNDNFTKNPNHSRPAQHAEDGDAHPPARGGDNTAPPAFAKDNPKGNATAPPANDRTNGNNGRHEGEDGTLGNQPQRGEDGQSNASLRGLERGRGHHKGTDQTTPQNQNQVPPETQTENQPTVVRPANENTDVETGQTQQTPTYTPTDKKGNSQGQVEENPEILIPPRPRGNANQVGHYKNQYNQSILTTPNGNGRTPLPNLGVNFSIDLNLRAYGNQPFGLIRTIVSQILRQNDIFLSNNTINRLINNQTFQGSTGNYTNTHPNLPREVQDLIRSIGVNVLSQLAQSKSGDKLIHQISREISIKIDAAVQAAKLTILKNADLGAAHFKNLNITEKMQAAVDLLPAHVPPKALESIQHHKAQEVLNGLLLARGLIVPAENQPEVRNLAAFTAAALPSEVSLTTMRDVGQLVKILISDTAAAKTAVNLDLAVQKFVKILLANNELGVLLATINLASQTQNQGNLVGRSIALAQIYDLINQLIQAGEKAMKNAAADKNAMLKDRPLQAAGLVGLDDFDESKMTAGKLAASDAAGSLRQFLEFNPAFVFDNSASAFNNQEDARQAQKDFVNLYHNDIEEWLRSGKHRYVKDFDFDKPVGVVVERSSEGVFSATTARFVLVRDGSVQGWHFLKSFLVR